MRAGESNAMLAAALDYIGRGWAPIPVPHRQKGPVIDGWQHLRITAETAPGYFNGGGQGLGVIVGKASGGLTDLDLDCPEAIAAAPYILPRTAVFGHASKPLSHWVYRTNLCETLDRAAIKFMGSDKTGLIEVRMGAGGMAAQTIFPPSTHISGEPIEWADGGPGKIAEVKGDELIQFARRLAAASELARSYPKVGGRHDAAFVLGGFLARCGFSTPLAATFVEAVAAASLQPGDKRRDMARTARDGAAAGKVAGFPLLAETFGEGAAKKVADWLDYAGEREGHGGRAAKGVERNDPNPDSGPESGPDPADAELERLAKLSPLKYERERKAAAEALALRASLLDRLVAAKRTEMGLDGGDGLPGRPITFDEIEPWEEPVDGAELLTDLSSAIGAYVIMNKHQCDAAALWAAHAHAHDLRDTSPPLVIKSPSMRSGKSKFVEVLERLVPRPLSVSGITVSFLERAIEAHHPTLLIDEYDALTSNDPALAEAARAQLNRSAKRRGAQVGKSVPLPGGGYESRLFSTWAASVIAGIGDPPATVRDRAVVIELKRKLSSEKVKPLRERDGADLAIFRRKLARFVADNEQRLRGADPEALAVDNDRAKDMWEPLLAIADVAGGAWPKRARDAGQVLAQESETATAEADVKLLLLADIRDIFAKEPEPDPLDMLEPDKGGRPDDGPRMSSKRLLQALVDLEERPWSAWGRAKKPLTGKALSDLLKPYKVRSTDVRIDESTHAKGYYLRTFDDVFTRYLPHSAFSSVQGRTNPGKQGESEDFQRSDEPHLSDFGKTRETPANPGFVRPCTDEKGGIGALREMAPQRQS